MLLLGFADVSEIKWLVHSPADVLSVTAGQNP